MPSVDINWWTVIVAAVVNMVVGATWYSPGLFGNTWAKLVNRSLKDMQGQGGGGYFVTAAAALIQAIILLHFVRFSGAGTVWEGVQVGFWLWLGFVGITSAVNTIYAGRPWKLWKIDAGYFLVVLIINSAIIAVWS